MGDVVLKECVGRMVCDLAVQVVSRLRERLCRVVRDDVLEKGIWVAIRAKPHVLRITLVSDLKR